MEISKKVKIWANTNLKDTSFVYKPLGAVIRVLNGEADVHGDTFIFKQSKFPCKFYACIHGWQRFKYLRYA